MKVFICILSFYHYEGDFSITKGEVIAVDIMKNNNNIKVFAKDNKLVPIEDSMLNTYFKEDQFALV